MSDHGESDSEPLPPPPPVYSTYPAQSLPLPSPPRKTSIYLSTVTPKPFITPPPYKPPSSTTPPPYQPSSSTTPPPPPYQSPSFTTLPPPLRQPPSSTAQPPPTYQSSSSTPPPSPPSMKPGETSFQFLARPSSFSPINNNTRKYTNNHIQKIPTSSIANDIHTKSIPEVISLKPHEISSPNANLFDQKASTPFSSKRESNWSVSPEHAVQRVLGGFSLESKGSDVSKKTDSFLEENSQFSQEQELLKNSEYPTYRRLKEDFESEKRNDHGVIEQFRYGTDSEINDKKVSLMKKSDLHKKKDGPDQWDGIKREINTIGKNIFIVTEKML